MGKNIHFIEFFYKFLLFPQAPESQLFQLSRKRLSLLQHSLITNSL